ncbi:MAG: tRNA (adenosine(37)-N6)-threonylcarbamoyltransferase complex dimerization subunit type 1 TsaB [Planctomycetota bacterium]
MTNEPAGQLTLAIETSNPSSGGEAGVALGRVTRLSVALLAEEPLGPGERHDDLLMPAIARLFDRAGARPEQLERLVVSIGPGGYTGLRIATAAASALSISVGPAVIGVPSAWSAARTHAREHPEGGPFAVALASKGNACWVTAFDGSGAPLDTPSGLATGLLCDSDRAMELTEAVGIRLWLGDRFMPERLRAGVLERGGQIDEPRFVASTLLGLAWSAAPSPGGVVTPLYGREAEAVTRWREGRRG